MCLFRCSLRANCLLQSGKINPYLLYNLYKIPCIEITWTGKWRLPRVAAPMPHQMFLPGECLAALHAVVRSLRFNAHVKFYVTVEVLPPRVGLRAALIGAMEQPLLRVGIVGPGSGESRPCVAVSPRRRPVMSVGVEGGQHRHGDRAVRVPSSPPLAVEPAPARDASPVEILLMPSEVFFPLKIFTTNSAEEWSLRLLTEMGDLRQEND